MSLIIVQYDASIQGNDQGKGKLPLTKEEIQNVGKKSDGDVRKSIKALVTAAMPEEFPKFKAGLRSGTEPPTPSESLHSQGEHHGLVLSLPGKMPMGWQGIINLL